MRGVLSHVCLFAFFLLQGEQLQCLQQEFELLRAQLQVKTKKGDKLQHKMSVETGECTTGVWTVSR